jgi:uncharacterized membrane protein (DUF373 family)
MLENLKKFERFIIASLILMMSAVILLAVGELAWILVQDIISPPVMILEVDELLEIFGLFLLVLIGIELLETIKHYYTDGKIELTVIFTVALIALSRKIIILEPEKYDALTLVGVGIVILALVAGYWATVTLSRHAPPCGVADHECRSSPGHRPPDLTGKS